MSSYTEYKTPQQSNVNFGETLKPSVKAPVIADRIFATYQDAKTYVETADSSAVAGLIISVIKDGLNNGVYYVNYSTTSTSFDSPLGLFKLDGTQSDFMEDDSSSPAFIKHRLNGNYGYFIYNKDGTITESPREVGFEII